MSSLFDVGKVPFSTFGSWMSIAVPMRQTELFLRNHHNRPNNLFTIRTIDGDKVVTPTIEAQPASLVLSHGEGRVEICFEGPDTVRMRGKGLVLQFAGERIHAYSDGANLVVFNLRRALRRYQVEALRGNLDLRGAYASQKEDLDNLAEIHGKSVFSALDAADKGKQILYVTPDGDGCWEIAVDEFWSTWRRPDRASFDDCLAASRAAFAAFGDSMLPAPAGLERARELAAYVNWSCTVNPTGLIKRPTIFMSKNWMNNVWSWDQCFNAMALAEGQPELAMDQMLTLVDHQDEFGAYPDAFNDIEIHFNYSKPPVHGFTFSELLRRMPERPPDGVMETMYASLGKQADWWMTYRVSRVPSSPDGSAVASACRVSSVEPVGQAAIDSSRMQSIAVDPGLKRLPYYLHGNDSGWDNSTMFARGVPLVAPDLAALLVVQMDVLAELAGELGRGDEADQWRQQADALFEALMDELWCGDHFMARLANDGSAVESQSLIPWLPLILGDRLPQEVRDCLKQGIEGHLTEWGLATERVDSPNYIADGYWRGPIWAPSTFLAVAGLDRSGYGDLADTVAERFCKLCDKSGFAENFDALTGDPLRDKAYTWTASVFLLVAERVNERG